MTYPTKGIVIAIAAAAVIAGPAIAADLLPRPAAPLYAPPLPTAPIGMTWSGFYIGGNLGAALKPNDGRINDISEKHDLSLNQTIQN